jgi:hypothetical protein
LPRNKAKTNEKAIKSLDLARFIACHALKLEKDIEKGNKKDADAKIYCFLVLLERKWLRVRYFGNV